MGTSLRESLFVDEVWNDAQYPRIILDSINLIAELLGLKAPRKNAKGAGAMSQEEIHAYVRETFGYRLNRTLDEIRSTYRFDVSCSGSVPEAITAFLESESFEDAVRKAVSLGGDSDTIACIAGAVAEAFYGSVPRKIEEEVLRRLDQRILAVLEAFGRAFGTHGRREVAVSKP